LRDAGVEVIGVSADDAETSERFRRRLELPFPLVADPRGKVTRAYRARWPLVGWAKRVTYLVGRDRTVRLAFHSERAVAKHAARVREEAARA
jgi:peroxiredoxin